MHLKKTSWLAFLLLIAATVPLRLLWIKSSLWLDESWVANSVQASSVRQMVYYDHWAQSTPVLFLLLERATAAIFGANEVTLRIVPWLAALAAAIIFAAVARQLFPLPLALLGVTLFSANYWDVKYAQQVKQYGTDLFASTVFLWLICVACRSAPGAAKRWLIPASAVLMCYLSSPSVFWLPSLAVAFAAAPLDAFDLKCPGRHLTPDRIRRFAISLPLFGVAAAANYLLFARPNHSAMLARDWEVEYHGYLGDQGSLPRFVDTLSNLIIPRSSLWSGVFAGCMVAVIALGAMRIVVTFCRRDPRGLPLLLAGPLPILAAVAASALHRYPVLDFPRLLLWMLPCCCVLLCFALEALLQWGLALIRLRPGQSAVALPIVVICLLGIAGSYLVMARHAEEGESNREMFRTVQASWRTGDALFVHGGVAEQFALYRKWLHWKPNSVYIAHSNWPCCALDVQERSTNPAARDLHEDVTSAVAALHPRRLWLVLANGTPGAWITIPKSELDRLPDTLDRLGCPVQREQYYGRVMLVQADCGTASSLPSGNPGG
jgi:hypothetical protein